MQKNKLWYLKQFNLFDTLNADEMESVSDMVVENQIGKKQPVYLEGDISEKLYFLKEGRVKITRVDESGKEITLTLLEPGEIFGELGLIDDTPRETTAIALEDSLICTIRRSDFEKLMNNKPESIFSIVKN